MSIDLNEAFKTFTQNLVINSLIMKDLCGVREIEFMPHEHSPLRIKGDVAAKDAVCRMPLDLVIAPHLLRNHCWQPEEQIFLSQTINGHGTPVALVDVGANIGIFTRQALNIAPLIQRAFLYEPHPDNYRFLRCNLDIFGPLVISQNVALAEQAGSLELHIDNQNCGNFSLNPNAVQDNARGQSVQIEALDIRAESARWMAEGPMIFYKSDTQGYDEMLATQLEPRFWEEVVGGIMEIWRIKKPAFSIPRFREILDGFPHKAFLDNPEHILTTEEILAYLNGDDYGSKDLGFRR